MNGRIAVRLVGALFALLTLACICEALGSRFEVTEDKILLAELTATPTASNTPTRTPRPTATPTATNTPTATVTPTETQTSTPTPVIVTYIVTATPTDTPLPTQTTEPYKAIVSGEKQLLYSAPFNWEVVKSIDAGTTVYVIERLRFGTKWIRIRLLTGEVYVMRIEALAPLNFDDWTTIPIAED